MSKQAMKKYVFAVYPLGLSLKIFTTILTVSQIIERKKNREEDGSTGKIIS